MSKIELSKIKFGEPKYGVQNILFVGVPSSAMNKILTQKYYFAVQYYGKKL